MARGAISLNSRIRVRSVVGNNLKDPFFDAHESEALACTDILEVLENSSDVIQLFIHRSFLRKLVRSHLMHIREIEKGTNAL